MAKRFIDTEIFNDEWFMDLSKDTKLFYIYYITNCDHAGVLKLNLRIAEMQTGIKSIQTVIEQLSNCLLTLKPNVYLMPAFIKYQYPNFPKSNVKQQDSVLKILSIYGIDIVGNNGKVGGDNKAKNGVYSKVIADDTTDTS